MKKLYALIIIILLCATPLFADEVDDGLSPDTPDALKAQTREMIRAGVASKEAVKMTRAMEQNRFQVKNITRAQEIVTNAVKEGLPSDPVMDKAYEGLVKGAPEQNVIAAMERTRARYSQAHQIARQASRNPDQAKKTGGTIAEGMAAGLTARDAQKIAERLRERERAEDSSQELCEQSFMAVREMVRCRVASTTATDTVCAALEHAYKARDMEMLRSSFMKSARYGNAAQLASAYADRIRSGMPAKDLGSVGRYGSGWSSGPASGTGKGAGAGSSGSGSGGQGSGSSGGSGSGGSGNGGSGNGGPGGSGGSGKGGSGRY